jgi:hypothetical protein
MQGMECKEWNARNGMQGMEFKEWNARNGMQGMECKKCELRVFRDAQEIPDKTGFDAHHAAGLLCAIVTLSDL